MKKFLINVVGIIIIIGAILSLIFANMHLAKALAAYKVYKYQSELNNVASPTINVQGNNNIVIYNNQNDIDKLRDESKMDFIKFVIEEVIGVSVFYFKKKYKIID